MVFFPLADGPAALEWEISPWREKWMVALAELEGGPENARALLEQHRAMVAGSERTIVRRRLGHSDRAAVITP